jgi:hypothetical protein
MHCCIVEQLVLVCVQIIQSVPDLDCASRVQGQGPGSENLVSWQLAARWQMANTAAF